MASTELIADYRRWLAFQRQEQLTREHQGVSQRLDDARATANQVIQAYRSMAEKAATEGAFYRTLFLREYAETALPCEGWLFVRRLINEENGTKVKATLLETFNLADGILEPGDKPARKLTLEIFDRVQLDKGMRTQVRVDTTETGGDFHFITLLDAARGDLRRHLD